MAKISCVIMASGESVRFGESKLTYSFNGNPLASYIMKAVSAYPFYSSIISTRWKAVAELARQYKINCFLHDKTLVSDSINLGTQALLNNSESDIPDGIMYCVADQPLLRIETIQKLCNSFSKHPESIIRLTGTDLETGQKRFANPVIFPKSTFNSLCNLPDGQTGRYVIKSFTGNIECIEASDPTELIDIDTKEQLEQIIRIIR